MFEDGGPPPTVTLTLYTDAFIIRGSVVSRQRRVTDILNNADDRFLVLGEVTSDEFGSHGETIRAEFAQINLASVLFAVADTSVETPPELRTPKIPSEALISIPPFKVTGQIHVMPEHSLREALSELTGNFLPVTSAAFWSDKLGEARKTAELVAVNHERTSGAPASLPRKRPSRRRRGPPPTCRRRLNRAAGSRAGDNAPLGRSAPRRYRSTGRSRRLPHSAQPPS
jgi:hypothetical protein